MDDLTNECLIMKIHGIMKKLVLLLLLLSLCYPPCVFSKDIPGDNGDSTVDASGKVNIRAHLIHVGYMQRGAFRFKKNAERLAKELGRGGYDVVVLKGVTSGNMKIYRVLVRKKKEREAGKVSSPHKVRSSRQVAAVKAAAVRDKDQAGERPAAEGRTSPRAPAAKSGSSVEPATGKVALSSAPPSAGGMDTQEGLLPAGEGGGEGTPEAAPQEEGPVGTLKTYRELFVSGGSYFHASLSVNEIYTDNAFATQDNKKSNLSTVITPAIWLTLPRVTEKSLVLDSTSDRMPGGLIVSRYGPEGTRRFQAHILYRPDIPLPSSNSPYGNALSHTLHADLTYKGNKISGGILDTFNKTFETRGLSVATKPGEIDRYYSNLFGATTSIDVGNRLRLSFDYSNFLVHFSDPGNSFRDRTDNTYSGYLFYKLRPKTSAFLEYTLVDISYSGDSSLDSTEHHFMAGVQWDITAKSRGRLKAGYDKKDFSNSSSSTGTFIAEAQINHQFTPKTVLTLTGFRKTDETNVETYLYTVTDQVEVGLQHILTSKITGLVDFSYANERYKGSVTGVENTADIRNNIYQATVGLQYEFQSWLRSSMGYIYTRRDSNVPDYNFSSNTYNLQVTCAF